MYWVGCSGYELLTCLYFVPSSNYLNFYMTYTLKQLIETSWVVILGTGQSAYSEAGGLRVYDFEFRVWRPRSRRQALGQWGLRSMGGCFQMRSVCITASVLAAIEQE